MFEKTSEVSTVDTIKNMPPWVVADETQQDAGETTSTEAQGWDSPYTTNSADLTPTVTKTQIDSSQPTTEPTTNRVQEAELEVDAELSKRTLAYSQSVAEMLNVADLSTEFKQADGLIAYLETDRDQIRVANPQLEAQIVELEEKLEQAKLKRAQEVMSELQNTESLRDELTQESLDNLPIEEMNIEDVDIDPELGTIITADENNGGTISTKEGKRSLLQNAVMLALFAYDVSHGGSSLRILTNAGSEWVMTQLGVNPEYSKRIISNSNIQEKMLYALNPNEVKDFLERRLNTSRRDEVITFLTGLSKETRIRLLSGELVTPPAGTRGNEHRLSADLISRVIASLSPREIQDLELEKIVAQRQTQAT